MYFFNNQLSMALKDLALPSLKYLAKPIIRESSKHNGLMSSLPLYPIGI